MELVFLRSQFKNEVRKMRRISRLCVFNPFLPTVPTFAVRETHVSRTANVWTVEMNGLRPNFCNRDNGLDEFCWIGIRPSQVQKPFLVNLLSLRNIAKRCTKSCWILEINLTPLESGTAISVGIINLAISQAMLNCFEYSYVSLLFTRSLLRCWGCLACFGRDCREIFYFYFAAKTFLVC